MVVKGTRRLTHSASKLFGLLRQQRNDLSAGLFFWGFVVQQDFTNEVSIISSSFVCRNEPAIQYVTER